ncbi:MAG TPA: cyclophilin-like fold protein [Syntrophorhabdales bacterium]|nr:cyclophilin-like fold protein [Syntrophorhabdales bacterium]
MSEEREMAAKIRIVVENVKLEAELFDTLCAQGIAGLLPIEAGPNVWGDEFYFEIALEHGLDQTATTDVEVGDIGFWPPGRALAIFFGPTPMSSGSKPVPASAVNLVGRITHDAALLRGVKGAARLRIEAA